MAEKKEIRQKIGREFIAGMKVDETLVIAPEAASEVLNMELSPEVAADFEAGLESVVGGGCGCGCGGSGGCGSHGIEASGSCHGCHNHG